MIFDPQWLKRESVKAALRPVLRWKPLEQPEPGFSIVLGTPWDLRHLLPVNLHFISRLDLTGLEKIHVVFDRTKKRGARKFIEEVIGTFPSLPLDFRFHPALAGAIVRAADQSKFYASLNWVTGLAACKTRYAVLHDFDLYPLQADFFQRIVNSMQDQGLRFSGAQFTHFDGLTDDDGLIGTWELGIDVSWLRRTYSPAQCFHKVALVNGRRVDLDAFSFIQYLTPQRALAVGIHGDSFVHVTNLCSTYLRVSRGDPVKPAWRLHMLWYLESLSGQNGKLEAITKAMQRARDRTIAVGKTTYDFTKVHPTCSNVLRDNLHRMETALWGGVRPQVNEYVEQFAAFLRATPKRGEPCSQLHERLRN